MKLLLFFLLLCFSCNGVRILRDETGEEILVRINHRTPEERKKLMHFNIDRAVSPTEVESYLSDQNQIEHLKNLNFKFHRVPNHASRALREFHKTQQYDKRDFSLPTTPGNCGDEKFEGEFQTYHNYARLTQFLHRINCLFPKITKLFSIGKSSKGRDLWVLRITSNADVDQTNKPKFKYVGNMHGDETVGRELLLRFILELVRGYQAKDARIAKLVRKTDIYILPSMNPDGFEQGTRSNGNGFDLNRNFPDQFQAWNQSSAQPETLAIMAWLKKNKDFVLSANFHGGDVVANYPYDGNKNAMSGVDSPSPDNEVFRWLSSAYARHNPKMFHNPDFPGGITNGAKWYVLFGGMQDFNYLTTNCMEITLEISMTKFPPPASLEKFWEENKISMLTYMEKVHRGVKGKVVDENGRPLGATIVTQEIGRNVTTNPNTGAYYRLLVPGRNYTISAVAEGRKTQSKTLTIPFHRAAVVDFVLPRQK